MLLFAAVMAFALAGAAQAKSRAFLAKPSKVTCVAARLGEKRATVRCDLPFTGRRAVFLHTRGKAKIERVSGFLHPRHRKVLRRGAQVHLGAFTCKSLRNAVTCRSGNGHGFTVGREFQLTF